jgi:hypothetical protein
MTFVADAATGFAALVVVFILAADRGIQFPGAAGILDDRYPVRRGIQPRRCARRTHLAEGAVD